MRYMLIAFIIMIGNPIAAQNNFICVVKDSSSNEFLPGVSVYLEGTTNGTQTDLNGRAKLTSIPDGDQVVTFSFLGYKIQHYSYSFPLKNADVVSVIRLAPEDKNLDEVVISSVRTNSRIEDLNSKVEVLGQDDMDEESTIVPGGMASILGDLSIITVQRTNPVNGNDAIRMQGLDARYTQIMRDGLPLYGGFSGSLGVLSIPPLDLKQVEIIKGSASTLYGGGAIGGLINFISKVPTDSFHSTLILNATTLNELNVNNFSSFKKNKSGVTVFAGLNYKNARDINGDGFAEVPEDKSEIVHPRFFYEFNSKNKLTIGLSAAHDVRKGGDIHVIREGEDSVHSFYQFEKSWRTTSDVTYTSQLSETHFLTFKTSGSIFQRSFDSTGIVFHGKQFSEYTELNDLVKIRKHTIVIGGNLISDIFKKGNSDAVLYTNHKYTTLGFLIQDDWQITEKISMESGIRYDVHSRFGNFLLPRLSFLFKPSSQWTLRLAGGTGYKIPELFDFENPSSQLLDVSSAVKSEHSLGLNTDIGYHTFLFGKLSLQIDQAFYYTQINDPIMVRINSNAERYLTNSTQAVKSIGSDTYLRLKYSELSFYLGYNHTESYQSISEARRFIPFNPQDKFSGTLAYDIEGQWRFGLESSWTGNQFIYNNQRVNNFWFVAAMAERKFNHISIVLNGENLTDSRQSKFEPLVTGTISAPEFKSIWAPLEGRVINLSVKIVW